jgi:hypothetical protein
VASQGTHPTSYGNSNLVWDVLASLCLLLFHCYFVPESYYLICEIASESVLASICDTVKLLSGESADTRL